MRAFLSYQTKDKVVAGNVRAFLEKALAQLAAAAKLDPERVFSAPWEVRAFAIAISLSESGAFKWSEFRERLIEEVARSDASQAEDSAETADRYYEHFLRALERVIEEKGIAAPR